MDSKRLEHSIERAALGELVRQLPNGLSTNVGERGATLSVGQKQRIGIARALYHGAEVIVFDEATSALDAATEKEIISSIEGLREDGCTVVMVSHRQEPLRTCSEVWTLESGRLVAN